MQGHKVPEDYYDIGPEIGRYFLYLKFYLF